MLYARKTVSAFHVVERGSDALQSFCPSPLLQPLAWGSVCERKKS